MSYLYKYIYIKYAIKYACVFLVVLKAYITMAVKVNLNDQLVIT